MQWLKEKKARFCLQSVQHPDPSLPQLFALSARKYERPEAQEADKVRSWASQCPQQDLSSNYLCWSEIAQDKCIIIKYAMHTWPWDSRNSGSTAQRPPCFFFPGTTILTLPPLWFLSWKSQTLPFLFSIYLTAIDTRLYNVSNVGGSDAASWARFYSSREGY